MYHDNITAIKHTKTAPMYHAVIIGGHTFILPRYIYWNSQRRYFTIDHNYYSSCVNKRTYVTGGSSSSTINDVIMAYEQMCHDLSSNDGFVNMSHLEVIGGKQSALSISHSIYLKHHLVPIHRITISKPPRAPHSYDVRYRTPMLPKTGYTRRCDMSKEGLVEAIQHVIGRAIATNDRDVNESVSVREFMKKYPTTQPLRYCGYETYGLNKISGIVVSRMPESQTYKITYSLNDVKYSVDCENNRQSIIDELIDIIGIYQMQSPDTYRKSASMIRFYHKYSQA